MMKNNMIKVEGDGRLVGLQVIVLKERGHFIAHAPALDLSAFGDTLEEAQVAFAEVVQIFLDDLIERGTLDEVLEGLGWEQQNNHWVPPMIISQTSHQVEIPIN